MKITFLGTSCMQPTKERNHPGILLTHEGEHLIFDCGEGTQRQLQFTDFKPSKLTKLFITHWHGDHVLGLPGLLQTLGTSEYQKTLHIYGPKGTQKKIDYMLQAFESRWTAKFKVHEVKKGTITKTKNYQVKTLPLKHNTPTQGYVFIERDKRKINLPYIKKKGIPKGPLLGKLQKGQDIKYKGEKIKAEKATKIKKGRKISYISDTLPCENALKLSKNTNLLICESSYMESEKDKAKEYQHMTTKDAAQLAEKAKAKKLYLTHFSTRYKNTKKIEKEAKQYFKKTKAAQDLDKVKL